jgi:endoglucanase
MALRLLQNTKRVRNSALKKSKFPSANNPARKIWADTLASQEKFSMDMRLLERLISAHGVSGDEDEVRRLIEKEIRPYATDISTDSMGNLIVHKKGTGPKVMLTAHMDEVGLMLKRIDDKGIVYCSSIGGIDPVVLIGQKVSIETENGTIPGVITCEKIWAGKDMKKLPNIEEIMIDTGLSKEDLQKKGVSIGSYIPLDEKTYHLGSNDIICGKALDDRTGCFILIELARRLKNARNEVYYVFTVQEEFGLYGARTSAFKIEPELGIAVDVTHANDVFPEPTRVIGNGPIITIKDGELLANKGLNERLIAAAKKKGLPYQLAVIEIGTTDATSVSVSKGGVPSTVFGVPIRNIHTTISIAHKKDIENAVKILEGFVREL